MHFSFSSPSRVWMGLLVLLLSWPGAQAEDLLEVYQLALTNDPRHRAAEFTYLADKQKLQQARAVLRPTINATADRSRIDLETETATGIVSRPAGDADINRTVFELTLTQPIYNRALFAGLRQARAEVRRADAQFATARQDLIIRVAEAYFGLLATLDNVELAGAEKAANARQLEVAEGRLSVGLATITDVHDARARFQLARAQEIEAINEVRDRRQALREITGRVIRDIATVDRKAPLVEPDPPDLNKWIKTALAQDPTLIAANETARIAREEVKRQRAQHWPKLDLVGSLSDTDDDESITGPGVETERTEIGLQLSVPIYQGGLITSLTKEAAHRYNAAQQNLEAQRRLTERNARAAFLGVTSGVTRIEALRQAVIASESALEAKTQGFEAGINTNLDVLDAQRDLFRAKRDLLDASYTYILNLLRLKRAAGIVSKNDLALINRWLR